jgi:hypothetical protein
MSMRGEVQTTKTILYPMAVNLGKVYIGVPVVFEITIENICNLPSKFKFERPGGEDPNAPYRIEFRPLRLGVNLSFSSALFCHKIPVMFEQDSKC